MKLRQVAFSVLLSSSGSSCQGALQDDDTSYAALSVDTGAAIYDDHSVASCAGENGESAACFWWLKSPPLVTHSFDALVVFFAGGGQGCAVPAVARGATYGAVADQYLAADILFVCANLYDSIDPARTGSHPFFEEAHRVEKLMNAVLSDPGVRAKWSGQNLLVAGVSHGATAPPIALKTLPPEITSPWKGASKTAACVLDGLFDAVYSGEWYATEAQDATLPSQQQVCDDAYGRQVCERYLGLSTCPAGSYSPLMQEDMLVDTATGEPKFNRATFPIKHWRITECGSKVGGCSPAYGDGVPAAPQEALCRALNATPERCDFESFGWIPHAGCALYPAAGDACIDWFKALPPD